MPHRQPYYDSVSDDDFPASKKLTGILKPSASAARPLSPPASPRNVHFALLESDTAAATAAATVTRHDWSQLFANGYPTDLFDDAMRGVAKFLIDRVNGIAVTPKLLQYFYTTFDMHSATDELYKSLFVNSTANYNLLAHLFADLDCEFCLVRGRDPLHPNIPALSKKGFATWMRITSLVHPSLEAARLDAVLRATELHTAPLAGPPCPLPFSLPANTFPAAAHTTVLRDFKDAVDKRFPGLRRHGVPGVPVAGQRRRGRPVELLPHQYEDHHHQRPRDSGRLLARSGSHRRDNRHYDRSHADASAGRHRRDRHRDDDGHQERSRRDWTTRHASPSRPSSRRP